VVVEVGGIGLRLEIPGRLAGVHAGEELTLHTHLVVREDSLTLYGFETSEEIEVFGILLGISGVGPRSALGVLTELTPAEIARAAAHEDESPFKKVSGIGPKTAKLIAVQLAGKLDPKAYREDSSAGSGEESSPAGARARVIDGLIGLGYPAQQAELAVHAAEDAAAEESRSDAELLRAALALLQAPRSATAGSSR